MTQEQRLAIASAIIDAGLKSASASKFHSGGHVAAIDMAMEIVDAAETTMKGDECQRLLEADYAAYVRHHQSVAKEFVSKDEFEFDQIRNVALDLAQKSFALLPQRSMLKH